MCGCERHRRDDALCTCTCPEHMDCPKMKPNMSPYEYVQEGHRLLDEAGVEVGGTLTARIRLLVEQRDTKGAGVLGRVAVPDEEDESGWPLKVALTNWWIDLAHSEVDRVVPKAVEYGSTDLMEVGRQLAMVIEPGAWTSHEEQTELGIYFYLLGKLARWTDAVRERRRPSDDTLHDIGIYVRMAQRTRVVGGWPTGNKEE